MKKILFLTMCIACLTACAPRVVIATPASEKAVVVKTPPSNYRIVRIKGKRYYKWNGRHYRKTGRGYVAVRI